MSFVFKDYMFRDNPMSWEELNSLKEGDIICVENIGSGWSRSLKGKHIGTLMTNEIGGVGVDYECLGYCRIDYEDIADKEGVYYRRVYRRTSNNVGKKLKKRV